MVANRALDPRSKLAMERWVGGMNHIEGLEAVESHALFRTMDFLIEHGDAIQEAVFFSVANLLNLKMGLLFFDTTKHLLRVRGHRRGRLASARSLQGLSTGPPPGGDRAGRDPYRNPGAMLGVAG